MAFIQEDEIKCDEAKMLDGIWIWLGIAYAGSIPIKQYIAKFAMSPVR